MPAARGIMNWFPRPNAAPLTKTCAFRKTFGTSLHIVDNLWFLFDQEDFQLVSKHPKHLLWGLHFMKVYTKQALGCAAVGASGKTVNPKTHQKWVWAYIEAIAKLVDKVVSLFIVFPYLSLQYDQCWTDPLCRSCCCYHCCC